MKFSIATASLLLLCTVASATPENILLPTANDNLFKGAPEKFYMHVDRTFEGVTSKPWQGGAYGYVRTPIRINDEVVLTKFHEGIDIAPLERDKAGNPLDIINSISDGTVAYVSNIAGNSNYGKYVVVEHNWNNTAVFSIYAHLSDISCKVGDAVKAGGPLGKMGFTGAGINRARSHLHLEIALKLSERFEDWNKATGGSKNLHGNFNGQNFTGVDAAQFFSERQKNPALQFNSFVLSTPVHFKVSVPSNGVIPEFARRHNWMLRGDAGKARSWEISFSSTGQPVAFTASEREVSTPTVTYLVNSSIPHQHLTRGLIRGENGFGSLTPAGLKLVALVSDDFPAATAVKEDVAKKPATGRTVASQKPKATPKPQAAPKPTKPKGKPAPTKRN
jgi:murein DD-endopeptidase MepM/ murein hydrolase activator NlpD